jgi:hypothetical protein
MNDRPVSVAAPAGVLQRLRTISSGRIESHSTSYGQNAYALNGTIRGVVTIHASNSNPPWWGLAQNVLRRLDEQQLRWAAVLLEHDNDHGYVWSGPELMTGVAASRWTAQEKGGRHFKFQRDKDFVGSYRFESAAELLGILRVILDGAEGAESSGAHVG